MNPFIRIIFILLLFNWMFAVHAQPAKQHSFDHYTDESGLVSNQVNSIVQDSTGFIWIATNSGLSRYDGIRYKNFVHNDHDSLSIPSYHIIQLVFDKDKNLWLLNSNGEAGIFDTKKFTYRKSVVRPANKESRRAIIKKLVPDEYGNLFLLFGGYELLTLNKKLNDFSPAENFIQYNESWKINDLKQQPGTHKYWMAVNGLGLAVYNASTKQLSYHGSNAEKENIVDRFSTVLIPSDFLFDHKNRLWFSSTDTKYGYIHCYDFRNQQVVLEKLDFISTYKTYYEVSGFLEQKDGTIWMNGFKTFGRYIEKDKNFELILSGNVHEKGIDYRYITCLANDREYDIWIGTGNNGVFRFNPSLEFFENIKHLSRATGGEGDGNPMSFYRDKDNSLLVGMWNDGLYRFDSNFNNIPLHINGIADNNATYAYDMFPSGDGHHVWISSQPGLYRYDQVSRSADYYNPAIFENKPVREIAEDKLGNLWIGISRFGLFKWVARKGGKKFEDGLKRFDAIPLTSINNISIDRKGFLWVATSLSGLYVIDPATDNITAHFFTGGKGSEKIAGDITVLALDYSDSIQVIATQNSILLYNKITKTIRPIHGNSKINGDICSVEKDAQGNLWIGTTTALFMLSIDKTVSFRFDRNDGIINDYFIVSASYQLPDKKMVFGTSGHILTFYPEQIILGTGYPGITITDFQLMNKFLSVDSLLGLKEIDLEPAENSLTIDFSTLTYNSAYPVFYQLKGVDKEPRLADNSNQLIYSYLPPGNYQLQFQVVDIKGIFHESPMVLNIHVNPPFYRTWWFYSLMALIVVSAIYWLDKQRIQRIRNEQELRISIASNLHKDVNTTLRNINVLSEIASMKSSTQPDQARDYLKEIQSKSRNMVLAMNDVLWGIDPENDSMRKTIERFQEIADDLNANHNSQIRIQIGESVLSIKLDMKTRVELIGIYKLILGIYVDLMESASPLVDLQCVKQVFSLRVSAEEPLPENRPEFNARLDEIRTRILAVAATMNYGDDGQKTHFTVELKI